MNDKWVGYIVSVHMKNNLGIYQGQISEATDSTLTLIKPFHNGVPHSKTEVVLIASDIEDIKLIDSKPKIQNGSSTVTVAKPIAKRMGRSISMCENSTVNKNCVIQNNLHMNHVKQTATNVETTNIENYENVNLNKNNTPLKKEKWKKNRRDEQAFGNNVESSIPDFDFEKNLALFNKQKVWEEINLAKPDVLQSTGGVRNKSTQKYRHDENVIQTNPTALRQIIVPAPDGREYVTDDGLFIPSVTYELRRQLFSAAEKRGLSCEKQIELMGRAATEMAIQLLGGGHRLNPYNTHQFPTVVILSGPNRQGAVGINCARQLASHSVNTIVFLAPTTTDELPILKSELSLYKLTNNKIITNVENLPANTDLTILALSDDSENPKSYPLISEWVKPNRSPVLALDPPTVGTPGISTKLSLVPVLPLSYENENGKIYLCNLGFPTKIYKDVGIKYRSPFGPKFVIPLHPNDL